MSRWFRVYDDLVDDPKVQRLPAELFKALVNLWCLASKNNGTLPPIDDIAFTLRVKPEQAYKILGNLRNAGLIEDDETGVHPHNWHGRQFKSDVSNERVSRYRQRKRNVTDTVTETPPETETETETEKKEEPTVLPKKAARKVKTLSLLSPDWLPSEGTLKTIHELGFGQAEFDLMFASFKDYWIGHGKPMADWDATLRNWARREFKNGKPQHGNGHKPGSIRDGFAKVDAVIDEYTRRENEGGQRSDETDDAGLPGLRQGSG